MPNSSDINGNSSLMFIIVKTGYDQKLLNYGSVESSHNITEESYSGTFVNTRAVVRVLKLA